MVSEDHMTILVELQLQIVPLTIGFCYLIFILKIFVLRVIRILQKSKQFAVPTILAN
jgi:hypothetical protein